MCKCFINKLEELVGIPMIDWSGFYNRDANASLIPPSSNVLTAVVNFLSWIASVPIA